MSLPERLRAAMNEARKHRDQARTLLLSTILADLKNREFELQHPPSDDETADVLRRGIKRRREAAEQYAAAGRGDRADAELAEVKALEAFLPAAVDPEEIRRAVREAIAGGVRDVGALAELGRALVAARIVAADLGRLADQAPRTAALRAAVPARELETRLAQSLDPEGQVLDGASHGVARARRAVREARQRLVQRLESILGSLDQTARAPDPAVTLRGR